MRNIKSMKAFEGYEFEDEVERLYEILEEIQGLMLEANDTVMALSKDAEDPIIYERWKAYPYGNIVSMLAGGNKYDTTFADIIDELSDARVMQRRQADGDDSGFIT
jgi:hypothetical protein